jgi:hypothetical protein
MPLCGFSTTAKTYNIIFIFSSQGILKFAKHPDDLIKSIPDLIGGESTFIDIVPNVADIIIDASQLFRDRLVLGLGLGLAHVCIVSCVTGSVKGSFQKTIRVALLLA